MKTNFIIFTRGRTASQWVCAALNLHPRIHCTHGPDLAARPRAEERTLAEAQATNLRIYRESSEFYRLSVDDYFDRMEAGNPRAQCYGSIHAYTPSHLAGARRRVYRLAHLTRHPVPRVESFVNRWKFEQSFNPHLRQWADSAFSTIMSPGAGGSARARELPGRHGVDFTVPENRLFLAALESLREDAPLFQLAVPRAGMEELTASPENFLRFTAHLTNGAAAWSPAETAALRALAPRDRRAAGDRTPAEITAAWAPWQRWYLAHLLRDTGLLEAYTAMGYDLREQASSHD